MENNKTATVYIDGFNLYYGMMNKGWGSFRWLNLYTFAEKIIPSDYKLGHVWYFTSKIKGDESKHNRQQNYLNALKAMGQIKIEYGNYQSVDSRCKHCGDTPILCSGCENKHIKTTEKMTDVNLSTYMITDCIEGLTNCVVLVSGDSDYRAPLMQIKRLFPSILRVVAYPPKRKNPAIEKLFDLQNETTKDVFAGSQLPNPVKNKKNGKKYYKPTTW